MVHTGKFCRVLETDKKGKSCIEVLGGHLVTVLDIPHWLLKPFSFSILFCAWGGRPLHCTPPTQAPCSLWLLLDFGQWKNHWGEWREGGSLPWLTSYGLWVGSDCLPLLIVTGRVPFLKSLLSLCVLKTHTLFSSLQA